MKSPFGYCAATTLCCSGMGSAWVSVCNETGNLLGLHAASIRLKASLSITLRQRKLRVRPVTMPARNQYIGEHLSAMRCCVEIQSCLWPATNIIDAGLPEATP